MNRNLWDVRYKLLTQASEYEKYTYLENRLNNYKYEDEID